MKLKNIDKSNWKRYRFDEIAKNVSERIDPNKTELTTYIGLEHIDSENIHITRSGTPDDVNGIKLRFYKGDIIFGRRRAYQRKAGIAKCDGFCSAHALVLRANPNIINPKLFPFFMHSDAFMDCAVNISVGSLSPTINWGTLKSQEFLLPPQEKQEKLAELLWAMNEVIIKDSENEHKYNNYYKRFMFDTISGKLSSNINSWKEYKFGDLGNTYGGLNGKTKVDFGEGFAFITYLNVFTNSVTDLNQTGLVNIKLGEKQNAIKYGDIIITGSSETPGELGMSSVVLEEVNKVYLNSFCFGFRLHDFHTLLPEYARFLMRSSEVRKFMILHAQGSTRYNLSKDTLKQKLFVKLPKTDEQILIANQLSKMENVIHSFTKKTKASQALQKSLINQIF